MITSMWLRPGENLSVPHEIRQRVFQQELGFSQQGDQDAADAYSFHLVLLLNDIPVATGRLSYERVGVARLSRICVLPEYRHQGIGDGLVKVLDYKASQLGMKRSVVAATKSQIPFYRRIGFLETGVTEEKYGLNLMDMEKETNDGTGENCAHQCACT